PILATPALPAAPGLPRTPDAIPAVSTGEPVSLQLSRGPGARPSRLRLPGDCTPAEAVSRLVGSVLPLRTDLGGALVGWWRLRQGDRPLPADATVASLDPGQPVEAAPVDNQLVRVELRCGLLDPPLRVQVLVGTAVPVASLLDHLAGWLSLPPGRYALRLDGEDLSPHHLLSDRAIAGPRPLLELVAAP
ncbi:hypothetical protein L6R53_32845, partial [Myxococcota bacterium]|nr:hypothetical protein [Myxococcota bacterium]